MQANAVLGGNAATALRNKAIDEFFHCLCRLLSRQTLDRAGIGGEVQVAIAQMAKANRLVARPALCQRLQTVVGKGIHAIQRQADVKVDRCHSCGKFCRRFTDAPQRLGL